MTTNEFTNVKDVRKGYLYTKDGYILMYLRVNYLNIDLLSDEEKAGITDSLAASFEGDRKDFVYFSIPREIDMDKSKQCIREHFENHVSDIGRRHILAEMMLEVTELATNGENFEHQHYIKLWKHLGTDETKAKNELLKRAEDFISRYAAAGITLELLNDSDILKMCTLFAHAVQAPHETIDSGSIYDSILRLR